MIKGHGLLRQAQHVGLHQERGRHRGRHRGSNVRSLQENGVDVGHILGSLQHGDKIVANRHVAFR